MFSSAKGKQQIDELKKIHEHRKKRNKKVNSTKEEHGNRG